MSTSHTFRVKSLRRLDADQAARLCAEDCGAEKGLIRCREMATGWIVSVFPDATDDEILEGPEHRYQVFKRGRVKKLRSR